MHCRSRLSRLWLAAAAVGLLFAPTAPIPTASAQDVEACTEDDEGKDGLCGHALAAIRRFQLEQELPSPSPQTLQAYADTDVAHVFLDIEIALNPKQISGTNTLEVTSKADGLTQFTLDLRSNMTVDSVKVNGTAAVFTRPTHQIQINLDRTYARGEAFQVQVAYHGLPENLNWGSFDFGQHAGTDVVASLSEPYYAHTWWPCKEAVDDKFTLDVWVTTPDWMTVASNGSLQGIDTLSGTRKRTRWTESYPISVYLVSLAATNYSVTTWHYNHAGGSMPVELYLYPEEQASVLPQVADLVQMIETLSDPGCFGEYPFVNEKYGIAQFEWCCGMEHQTITSQGSFPERRNVHELAHSWWGNHITCKTWHDIWLNEGFARYAEALWHERKPGGGPAAYLSHMDAYRPSSYGGTVYRYDISTADAIFSTTNAYNKGSWVLHMLRHVIGDEAFFGALAAYRAAYAGTAADTPEFQAVVEAHTGRDLAWFFDRWVYNAGAPYYRYGWQSAQIGTQHWGRLYVAQYQTSWPKFRMPIDITITGGGVRTHVIEQRAEAQWYLLPATGPVTGVAFDKDTWILRGAASNVTYIAGPPKVIATTPAPGSVLDPAPDITAITLQFSEPITYCDGDFVVVGGVSGPRSVGLDYSPADYVMTLALPEPLPAGQTWTVTVRNTVKSQAGGLSLDGEMSAGLPSGDGLPGGSAVFTFELGQPPPPCPDPFADADADGDVDQTDFGILQTCLTGEGDPEERYDPLKCWCLDRDGDHDVDGVELGIFRTCASGPRVPADAACDDAWTLFGSSGD